MLEWLSPPFVSHRFGVRAAAVHSMLSATCASSQLAGLGCKPSSRKGSSCILDEAPSLFGISVAYEQPQFIQIYLRPAQAVYKLILVQIVFACADGVAKPFLVFDYYGSFHHIIEAVDKVLSLLR